MKLGKEAQSLYDSVRKEYDISDAAGLAILRAACESLEVCRKAEVEIEKHGLTITDKYTKIKSNPACTVLKEHKTLMLNYLKALNLDLSTIQDKSVALSNLK